MKVKKKPLSKIFSILKYPAWVVFSVFVAQLIILPFNVVFRDLSSNNIYKALISAIFYTALIVILIFVPHKFFKKSLPTRHELGLKGTPTWTDILLAIIGFIVYILIAYVLTNIIEKIFPSFDATQEQALVFDRYLPTFFDRVLVFTSIAVIPPIAEEITFRGWLYPKLKKSISGKKSKIISIIIVSILFGFMHGQWNVGVSVFVMSVVFCLIRELTGTIYGSILMHITANTIAFYLLYILNMV